MKELNKCEHIVTQYLNTIDGMRIIVCVDCGYKETVICKYCKITFKIDVPTHGYGLKPELAKRLVDMYLVDYFEAVVHELCRQDKLNDEIQLSPET